MPRRTHNRKALRDKRRDLRRNATPAERQLWSMLRRRQLCGRRFRRQYSIGAYIVDFYCPDEHLAVELDGAVHDDPARRDYDGERERYLRNQGLTIARFENRAVFETPDVVLDAIAWHFEDDEDA